MAEDEHNETRAKPVAVGPASHRHRAGSRGGRRPVRTALISGLLVTVLAAAAVLGLKLWHTVINPETDYHGPGERDIVIQVHDGDTTTAIGETLHDAGVIATVRAFVDASYGNPKITAIQPGFYQTRTRIPAASAVQNLTDPHNRVGMVVIPEGSQLDDTTYIGTGAVTPGIFTQIADASCVELDGTEHCVDAGALRSAAADAGLASLNVPDWATERVEAMGREHRRIEGLIAPGTWNINPLDSAEAILATLIGAGVADYEESGLQATAAALKMSPYDVLVVASLVQREGKPHDYAKVARVIYNRLNSDREMLEFDSTVNYPLERREVATSDADRHRKTPWNTYVTEGLPATPIGSPDADAVHAAENPEPGDWLYFVTVDTDGTTLFTDDYQQHLSYIEQARENGVLESNG